MLSGNPMTRLYLRIWLAVVVAVILVTVGVGAVIRTYYEMRLQEQIAAAGPPTQAPLLARDITVRDETGQVLTSGSVQPTRIPGVGIEYPVKLKDGRDWVVLVGPRMRASGAAAPGSGAAGDSDARPPRRNPSMRGSEFGPPAGMLRPAMGDDRSGGPGPNGPGGLFGRFFGFGSLVLTICIAVAIGAYPVVRRLTQRLESLKTGVQRFGQGDLSTRVPVVGKDEIAYLTEQFNESAARIEALVTAHKSLMANASHELRSPLARLRMGLELSQSGVTPALQAEMSRSITELDELIGEILLASRLSATSTSTPGLGPADGLGLQADQSVDMIGLLAEECSKTHATLSVDESADANVNGDARLLRRLVRNLLENARRYGGNDIQARWRDTLILTVTDSGPGVPSAQRERIFEPFYRLPGASEASGGVGLGLSLVKTIAQHHGASVACVDRADGLTGACFEVRFQPATRGV